MAASQVVKITSKGQFTLPVEIRRELSLGKDSHVYVTKLGRLIVIKKVEELSLDDISAILEPLAKRSGLTRRILMEDIEKAREKMLGEKQGKVQVTVLIDTNILVSGLVFLKGNEHRILKLAEEKAITLVLPEFVLKEARAVLGRRFPGHEIFLDTFLLRAEHTILPWSRIEQDIPIRLARPETQRT